MAQSKAVGADFADKRCFLEKQEIAPRHLNPDGSARTGNRRIAPSPKSGAKK